MGKQDIVRGHINVDKIKAAHGKIKSIVEAYKDVNKEVSDLTIQIQDNWVGKGRNEFESQYNILIKKIEDFGDTLADIYDALVEADAQYGGTDDGMRQQFDMAMEG